MPAGQTLTVRSQSERDDYALLRFYPGCCASQCLTTGGRPVLGAPSGSTTRRWTNATGEAHEVFVALTEDFELAISHRYSVTATLSPTPTERFCPGARAVTDGTTLRAQDVGAGVVWQPLCPGTTEPNVTPVLFYTATVPAGHWLSAYTTLTTPAINVGIPFLRVVSDCTLAGCLATSTSINGPQVLSWYNALPTARTVLVTLGTSAPDYTVPVDVTFRVRPVGANAACAGAVRVSDGSVLVGDDLAEARERSALCADSGAASPVLYYVIRVGQGQQLRATAEPLNDSFSPVLRVAGACATGACVAGLRDTSELEYLHTGPARDVVVMLTSTLPIPAVARARLSFRVTTPPYAVSHVPTACDDMTAATAMPELAADNAGSLARPLPFTFPYFGAPMVSWSASTNGYLQIWPSTGGSSGGVTEVGHLPNGSGPYNMLAAFHDDLNASAPAVVRWAAFTASSPRHFTIEWNNVSCGGAPSERMTFQARLFETGAVEYHYCALSPSSSRATGTFASIGMQSGASPRGPAVSFAYARRNAVDTAHALRFVPIP